MIDANKILNNFPEIELSYEKNLYNKVLSTQSYFSRIISSLFYSKTFTNLIIIPQTKNPTNVGLDC